MVVRPPVAFCSLQQLTKIHFYRKPRELVFQSWVAQGKRVWLITRRTEDQNLPQLLNFYLLLYSK